MCFFIVPLPSKSVENANIFAPKSVANTIKFVQKNVIVLKISRMQYEAES